MSQNIQPTVHEELKSPGCSLHLLQRLVRAVPGLKGVLLRRDSHLQTGLSKPWGSTDQLWSLPMHLLRYLFGRKRAFPFGGNPRPPQITKQLLQCWEKERTGREPEGKEQFHICTWAKCHKWQSWFFFIRSKDERRWPLLQPSIRGFSQGFSLA